MFLSRFWKGSSSNKNADDENYLAFVRATCADVDLVNRSLAHLLALPLTAVFTPLQLTPDHQPASKHPLAHYLAPQQPPDHAPHLLLLGPPGSGKTTLLRQLTHTLAHQPASQTRHFLPILLPLRDIATPIRTSPIWSLADAIMGEIAKHDYQIKAQWIRDSLQAGKFLILLDGLDEINDGQFRDVVQRWIERQMKIEPNARFIISSRPFAHERNPLNHVIPLHINPLTIDAIEQYVHDWFHAAQRQHTPNPSWQKQAEQTIQMLHQHAPLLELAHTPLLLRLLINVHTGKGSFAARRVQFLAQLCDIWLGGWRQALGIIEDLTAVQKQRVLQQLAHHMTQHQQAEISFAQASQIIHPALKKVDQQQGAQFLRMVAHSSGLLIAQPSGHYRFAHPLVQDYLTAVFLQQERHARQHLHQHINSTHWHQAILFYAILTQNPLPIVRACLQKSPPSVEALTLAKTVLQEMPNHPETQALSKRLHNSGNNQNPAIRHTYAQVIKADHLHHMRRFNQKTAVSHQLVPNAMYQLFIQAQRQKGRFHQPDHWQAPHDFHQTGDQPALGIRASDALAFCHWLSQAEPDWFYRLPTPSEAQELLTQSGFWQRNPTSSSGFWVANAQTMRLILDANAQDHWQANANLADRLTFDLGHMQQTGPHAQKLSQQLLRAAQANTFTLSPRHWLTAVLPTPTLRPALRLAFSRNASGQLRTLGNTLSTLSQAIENGRSSQQIHHLRQQLHQQAQQTSHTLQQFEKPAKLQQQRQMLTQQFQKLHGQLPLRPSLINQALLRQLSQTDAQLQRVAATLNNAIAKARLALRVHSLKKLSTRLSPTHHSFYQDLYLDLAIINGRSTSIVSKRQPPLEGIRLFRERATMKE